MITPLTITTLTKKYQIHIGENIFQELINFWQKNYKNAKLLLITDNNVAKLHLNELKIILAKMAQNLTIHIVPPGEESKNFDSYKKCLDACFKANLNRNDLIIAFGGGVIGDLAGFTAATYMRGIAYIQVPTTLLAHDSAIGGKVGINSPYGKNLIGSFYQPEAVFYHLNYLNTLPDLEWKSGFAEIIKEALISEQNFFYQLQTEVKNIPAIKKYISQYIVQGMQIKANIVNLDEKETNNIRIYLNFGHTLGHALEKTISITHGEAVMFGIVFALELSIKYCQLNCHLPTIKNWLLSLGYLSLTEEVKNNLKLKKLINYMHFDKKNNDKTIGFVLLAAIGKPVYMQLQTEVVETELAAFINRLL